MQQIRLIKYKAFFNAEMWPCAVDCVQQETRGGYLQSRGQCIGFFICFMKDNRGCGVIVTKLSDIPLSLLSIYPWVCDCTVPVSINTLLCSFILCLPACCMCCIMRQQHMQHAGRHNNNKQTELKCRSATWISSNV